MYRSNKFRKYTRNKPPVIPGEGQTVDHHVKMLCGGGMGLKPDDSHVLPIPDSRHRQLDSPGHSEKSVFMECRLSPDDVKAMIRCNICEYLDDVHNIDPEKLIIELLTQYMEDNKL